MFFKKYDITIENDLEEHVGSIFGYITENMDQFKNFLERHSYSTSAANRFNGKRIGVIDSMSVEENERNNGVGSELMKDILGRMEKDSVNYIFLVCDRYENNTFSLQRWYEKQGFAVIAEVSNCPLMVKCYYA